jgi:hypothetical protein
VTEEEWRVSLVIDGQGTPVSPDAVLGLLRSRVGAEVSVTAGKAGIFLYAASADAASAAQDEAVSALAGQGLAADIRLERWDPQRRSWLAADDAGLAGPPSQQEPHSVRRRLSAIGAVLTAVLDGIGQSGA